MFFFKSKLSSFFAGPSVPTKVSHTGGRQSTVQKIRAALEKAGIEFIDENGGGPGVRLPERKGPEKAK
jgi:hypothetical protein